MEMPITSRSLACRVAKEFDISLQLASFLILVITSDYVTPQLIADKMGDVDGRNLAHRLRRALPPAIELRSRRCIGYWLDNVTRQTLINKFGLNKEIDFATANLHRGADDWRTAF